MYLYYAIWLLYFFLRLWSYISIMFCYRLRHSISSCNFFFRLCHCVISLLYSLTFFPLTPLVPWHSLPFPISATIARCCNHCSRSCIQPCTKSLKRERLMQYWARKIFILLLLLVLLFVVIVAVFLWLIIRNHGFNII